MVAEVRGAHVRDFAVANGFRRGRPAAVRGDIAVMSLTGVVSQRSEIFMEFFGGVSTEQFGTELDSLVKDNRVGAIVLDVDSPGGDVAGVSELSKTIFEARGSKPIIAVANSMAASAAYWIASAADKVFVTPGGQVGSVGVLAIHQDISALLESEGVKMTIVSAGEFKDEGNPYEPLGDEAHAEIQRRVDDYYGMFVGDLARNRGVSRKTVLSDFGQGRMLGAAAAVKAGMADRVATLDETLARLTAGGKAAKKRTSAEVDEQMLKMELTRL